MERIIRVLFNRKWRIKQYIFDNLFIFLRSDDDNYVDGGDDDSDDDNEKEESDDDEEEEEEEYFLWIRFYVRYLLQ